MKQLDPRKPDHSFAQFAEQLNPFDRRLALGFVEGFDAAYPEKISAHALLLAEQASEKMEGGEQSRLDRGYSALVEFLAKEARAHGARLLTQAAVRSLRWKSHQVEVVAGRNGAKETFSAEAVVISVSLGVLRSGGIKFDPPLTQKQDAIEHLEMGNVVRILLLFDKRWWPGGNFGFIHAFDKPIPTWWSDSRGPVLTGWAGGPKADALLTHSPAEVEALGLRILGEMFEVSNLRAHLRSSHTYNWARDPEILGAYSYIPVKGVILPKILGEPLAETLFFAGEATVTDCQMGTVFGAFDSGLRAAQEVLHG